VVYGYTIDCFVLCRFQDRKKRCLNHGLDNQYRDINFFSNIYFLWNQATHLPKKVKAIWDSLGDVEKAQYTFLKMKIQENLLAFYW
jgi:hypothetical protein